MSGLIKLILFILVLQGQHGLALEENWYDTIIPGPHRELTIISQGRGDIYFSQKNVKVVVLNRAIERCNLEVNLLKSFFQSELSDSQSRTHTTLRQLFPINLDSFLNSHLTIYLDHFPDGATFGSYYVSDFPSPGQAAIGLDCRVAKLHMLQEWRGRLVHELVHFLSQNLSFESWFEEGLAQKLEVLAGGRKPLVDRAKLSSEYVFPGLLDTDRPLQSSKNYWASFAFVNYLMEKWFVPGTMKSLIEHPFDVREPFLPAVARRAKKHLQDARGSEHLLTEKTTANGWLRFFAVALTLNISSHKLYSVDDDVQLRLITEAKNLPKALQPTQFFRTQGKLVGSFIGQDKIEVYGIETNGNAFKIKPIDGNSMIVEDSIYLVIKLL